MQDRTPLLNWAIWGYIALDLFGSSQIANAAPAAGTALVLVPIALLTWQTALLKARINEQDDLTYNTPIYDKVQPGDWWRLFGILWIGHKPLATEYLLGFYLFAGIVVTLVGILAFTAAMEWLRKREFTPMFIGSLVFIYFLLVWGKNAYVNHYGIPVIGHFFERPQYDTQYGVEVESEHSMGSIRGTADIHVEGRTETEDYGEEGGFSPSTARSYMHRDVWVRKIHLPNGQLVMVAAQDEPLHLGESVILWDSQGESWRVRLLNAPKH